MCGTDSTTGGHSEWYLCLDYTMMLPSPLKNKKNRAFDTVVFGQQIEKVCPGHETMLN